ncbi:YheC/YheD family protein [Phyllobacterium phragmitis]|nr:YheC/YheD family protein [Phyllobacterium phragmitis]
MNEQTNAWPTATEPADSVLRVGMLRINTKYVWQPQHTACAMMYTARQFDIELFLFHPDDVDLKTRTINGLFLVHNEKVRKRVPFPPVIENSILDEKEYGELLRELEKDSVLVRHPLRTTKLRTYDTLVRDGRFASILIPTEKFASPDQIIAALEKHGNIIIKPASGGRGSGVRRLSKQTGSYLLTEKNTTQHLDEVGLVKFLRELEDRKVTYVWQPYIGSRTKSGNPFDIRIHARRGHKGKFQIHLFPRIGNATGVVSNISSGGYSMDINVFLRQEFGDMHGKVKNELVNLGNVFPEYYQSFHKPTTLFDVGLDIGIQQCDGVPSLHLFEVNTYIDGPFFEIEDAITHFEYFRHLEEQRTRQKAVS